MCVVCGLWDDSTERRGEVAASLDGMLSHVKWWRVRIGCLSSLCLGGRRRNGGAGGAVLSHVGAVSSPWEKFCYYLLVCLCLLEIPHVIISRADFYFLAAYVQRW